MKSNKTTLVDIANALGVSIGTVDRALHNYPGINQETKMRVLQEARKLGYRANRAARSLSLKRKLRISVNTLKGTTSFWDEVRTGIEQEAKSLGMESVDIEYRTYPRLGDGDEAAFEAALKDQVNGMILFPSSPGSLRGWLRRAAPAQISIVCVATDAPGTGRLAVVSIDTMVSGSLAADLLGRFLNGQGSVAVTVRDLAIVEHAEKVKAFQNTFRSFYPQIQLETPIEDRDIETEAYPQVPQALRIAARSRRNLCHHGSVDTGAECSARRGNARPVGGDHDGSLPRASPGNPFRDGGCNDSSAPPHTRRNGIPGAARFSRRWSDVVFPVDARTTFGHAWQFGFFPSAPVVRAKIQPRGNRQDVGQCG